MLQTTVVLSEPNYAGNIIINLASLPDFLRKPILKKRMIEFFSMSEPDKSEIINNALEAGPTIPFPNFSKLFKTWLEVLCTLSEENRHAMFSNYIKHIINSPEKIIAFNLDGILEIFLSLEHSNQEIISISIQNVFKNLEQDSKRKLILLVPENARLAFRQVALLGFYFLHLYNQQRLPQELTRQRKSFHVFLVAFDDPSMTCLASFHLLP